MRVLQQRTRYHRTLIITTDTLQQRDPLGPELVTPAGVRGRRRGDKSLVVIAVEVEGKSIGRIRLRSIADASAASLHSFIADAVEPGSTLHTDGWPGYKGLEQKGYLCETSVIGKQPKDAVKLLPHVHLIVALLKRWLMGTHQGAVGRVY